MPERFRRVFYDPDGARWKRVSRGSAVVSGVTSVLLALFIFTILLYPSLPAVDRYQLVLQAFDIRPESRREAAAHFLAWRALEKAESHDASISRRRPHAISTVQANNITAGFYVNWDANSFSSIQEHIGQMNMLLPCWLSLSAGGASFTSAYSTSTHDADVELLARTHHVPIIPVLANQAGGNFDWTLLRGLLQSSARQHLLARQLHAYLRSHGYDGINIDFEMPDSAKSEQKTRQASRLMREALPNFLEILRSEMRGDRLLITQDVPPWDAAYDYDRLGDLNDFLIVMQYDQHTAEGEPGPIAAQTWLEKTSNKFFACVDASKVILGVGNYAYDWPVNLDVKGDITSADPGISIPLASALSLARVADAPLHMDDDDLNPYFFYNDDDGKTHIVYLLDAVTAWNQVHALRGYQPRGAALWYLGSEDPTLWSFFSEGRLGNPVRPAELARVDFHRVTDINGDPSADELMQISATDHPGTRLLRADEDGLIVEERYQPYPAPNTINQIPIRGKVVALTFDDGPDPVYTPEILAILRQKHVPATFFIVGEHAVAYPRIVRECWKDGNELGNHSYSHPHIARISPWRLQGELTGTDRLIESITGRGNLLFRPPYGEGPDSNLAAARDIPLLAEMQRKEYLIVGMNIDPQDYLQPPSQEIVRRVEHALAGNHVILLHDSGGARENTVKALPLIIDVLQRQGYRFVTVSQLLPPGWQAKLFPPLSPRERVIAGFDRVIFETWYVGGMVLRIAILISIAIGMLRLLLMVPLILHHRRRVARLPQRAERQPGVTVVIPAYNEEAVIVRTVASVLKSDYPDVRVIVVDDGSSDGTQAVLLAAYADHPQVHIHRQENAGKSTALNRAFAMAETDVVVCIDADTLILPDTIALLVRQFADPRVGAVAGNVKVGNRINALTLMQSLEYITNQNFERQAYAALDAVAIVPGAISGWRREAVLAAGGFLDDTLAEDMDLTFRVRRLGYFTRCDNMALAFTEAPATLRALLKQRFRWTFGVLQTLWKHRRIIGDRRFGAFSLLVVPSMWVTQLLLQLLVPFVDLGILAALFNGRITLVALYLTLFLVLDGLIALTALGFDRESWAPIAWLVWQRIFYREFNWYLLLKSLLTALHGSLVGWGKLSREASVTLPETQ